MQVTAHEIVRLFGIGALSALASDANATEIAQCRADWEAANASSVYLRTFNDGDNVFEVVFHFDQMRAVRTDYGTDVTSEYAADAVKAITRRIKLRVLFGLE